jgi:hypothetical protein
MAAPPVLPCWTRTIAILSFAAVLAFCNQRGPPYTDVSGPLREWNICCRRRGARISTTPARHRSDATDQGVSRIRTVDSIRCSRATWCARTAPQMFARRCLPGFTGVRAYREYQ